MLSITTPACGVNTRHSRGCGFDASDGISCWLFMYFHTPFFYEIDDCDGKILISGKGSAGDCLLHSPGSRIRHGPASFMSVGFMNDWLYFSGEDAETLVGELKLPVNKAFHIGQASLAGDRIGKIIGERKRCFHTSEFAVSLIIAGLLLDVARDFEETAMDEDTVYLRLSELRSEVLSRCGEEWSLQRLASMSGYSKSRFSALYSHYFGISPMADLIRVRIENARSLLLYSEYSIGRISELCGFSSIQYFSRTYRAVTGETPSEVCRSKVRR